MTRPALRCPIGRRRVKGGAAPCRLDLSALGTRTYASRVLVAFPGTERSISQRAARQLKAKAVTVKARTPVDATIIASASEGGEDGRGVKCKCEGRCTVSNPCRCRRHHWAGREIAITPAKVGQSDRVGLGRRRDKDVPRPGPRWGAIRPTPIRDRSRRGEAPRDARPSETPRRSPQVCDR